MAERTLLLSDLHNGSLVSHTSQAIQCILRVKWDRLVLPGDINDSDSSIDGNGWRLFELLGRFHRQGRQVIRLPGNHDPLSPRMARVVGLDHADNYYDVPSRTLVTHGHVDPYERTIPWDRYLNGYKTPTRFANQVESDVSFYGMALGRWLAKRGHQLRRRICDVRKQVKEAALACADRHNFACIVCGHTHFREEFQATRFTPKYVNLGSWCQDEDSYGIIENGEVHLEVFRG